ncbi:MAG: acetyl-CoA carboxylase biotin carboxyl carrier protein [Planctomycetota bacterium]|jgi:acetyl-CoA carboxylase biotin carboxyl carrier protein
MLDIRKLKELVRLMVANDLTELDLRDSEEQVTLRRQRHTDGVIASAPALIQAAAPAATVAAAATAAPPATTPGDGGAAEAAAAGLTTITSPMVGTFYAAPNPDAPPFVAVGANVDPESVVCLVEAMKIFNEIKAECRGTIEKVLVDNGDAVDFGQPLFHVRPA